MLFHWNEYDFDPQKQYLINYRGCFCPPTRGHYELIQPFLGRPNVKILISQVGGATRHGVPFSTSKRIWRKYLADPEKRVIIEQLRGSHDVKQHLTGIDIVVYLKGKELSKKREERKFLHDRRNLMALLERKGIPFHALIVDRPLKDSLSATLFVQALLSRKEVDYYMPDHLSKKDSAVIIRALKKCRLH